MWTIPSWRRNSNDQWTYENMLSLLIIKYKLKPQGDTNSVPARLTRIENLTITCWVRNMEQWELSDTIPGSVNLNTTLENHFSLPRQVEDTHNFWLSNFTLANILSWRNVCICVQVYTNGNVHNGDVHNGLQTGNNPVVY